MEIRIKPFSQEEYEKSIARVLKVLSLEQKLLVRNSIIEIADAIDKANELKKGLDSIDLNQVNQPKGVEKPVAKPIKKPKYNEIMEEERQKINQAVEEAHEVEF